MRHATAVLILATLATPLARAQAGRYDPTPFVPRYTVSLGYQFIRANAPPDDCGCFNLNGGYVSGAVNLKYWLRAAAEVTGTHGNNIGPLGQNLTLLTYTAGPQVVLHPGRFEVYGQALFGAAHGSDSYFPSSTSFSTSANSFAYSAGGGIDYILTHRFAVRVGEVQYLHTGFPNATNGAQSHLTFGAGIVLRLHGRLEAPDPGNQRAKAEKSMRNGMDQPAPVAVAAATPAVPPPPAAAAAAGAIVYERGSHDSFVEDAFFDYDQSDLRPDARQSLVRDAAYFKAHPDLHVVIGGYADERGSAEYDLALGERRAQAARDALVAAGVPPDQMETISYGKEVQACTDQSESCFQKNRRAGFEIRR